MTQAEGWVRDDVWARLDPASARLPRRTLRRIVIATIGAVAVLLTLFAGRISGQTEPQVFTDHVIEETVHGRSHTFSLHVRVDNVGWFDEHILGIDSAAPGLRLVRSAASSRVIPANGSAVLTLAYHVTNCRTVQQLAAPVALRLHRWWGTATAHVDVQSLFPDPTTSRRSADIFVDGAGPVTCGAR